MKKIALYTINSNNYDTLNTVNIKGVDCYVLTDDENLNIRGWKTIVIEKGDVWLQRKYKVLQHTQLLKYDVTVYIDANFNFRRPLNQLLRYYKGGLMIGEHYRNCVYDEAVAIKEQNKADHKLIDNHIQKYKDRGFNKGLGMWSAGLLVRDNTTRELCELWWEEMQGNSHRDQMALPYAVFKTGIKPQTVKYTNFFKLSKHKRKLKKDIKVFYSSPYRNDKNIGKANNEFIKLLPEDAWVCITDADTCFLNPDYGTRIENIINKYGNEWDLIGCLTNRIGSKHQTLNGFDDDLDMAKHYEIATGELNDDMIAGGVAGFLMLFSKKTWKKAGGFRDGITADTWFNRDVKRNGGKVGVYQGLYIFHAYRIWEKGNDKARHSTKHLAR